MAKIPETHQTKEQKCRTRIANFLSAMRFHDPNHKTTLKLMRKKLLEIQRKEAANYMIKNIPTTPKITIKFFGSTSTSTSTSTSKPSVRKRPHSQTLRDHDKKHNLYVEKDSRNSQPSCSKTLIPKRQNMIKNLPTTPKITVKFFGSTSTSPSTSKSSVHKRRHSQTLHDHDQNHNHYVEKDSRNPSTSCSKTLIHKRQKNNDNGENVMDFIRSLGGFEAELVIEKRLTLSDVSKNLGRLLIPALKVKKGFLTADEETKLGKREDVSVWVVDLEKSWWTLNLAKWKMSSEYYVLKTSWNDVVNANGLKEGMVIRIFSFRVDQKLCFALDLV